MKQFIVANKLNIIMKKLIFFLFSIAIVIVAHAQKGKICNNIYVWEFSDGGDQRNVYTSDLTNITEEILVKTRSCNKVLQRRKYGSLKRQIESERQISSMENIKKSTKDTLKLIGADMVLFGTLTALGRKEYELRLSMESLVSTNIIDVETEIFTIVDLHTDELKEEKIKKMIYSMLQLEYIGEAPSKKGEKKERKPWYDVFTKGTGSQGGVVTNCLTGYEINVVSCKGNKGAQTVTVFMEFEHAMINQNLYLRTGGSKAYGNKQIFDAKQATLGNEEGSTIYQMVPTGVTVTGSITFKNVLPTTAELEKAVIKVSSSNNDGGKNNQQCDLELSNMTIQW